MKIKIKKEKVDPFKVSMGKAYWKVRKQGAHVTSKGRKVSRSVRNRVSGDDV